MSRSRKLARILIAIGFIISMFSFLNLMLMNANRAEYRILDERIEDDSISRSLLLEGGHNYTVWVTLQAEAYWGYVEVRGYASISINGTLVAEEDLHDDNGDDDETGAADSVRYFFIANGTTNVTMYGEMQEGQNWQLRIYQDEPDRTIMLLKDAFVMIAGGSIFLVGLVLEMVYILRDLGGSKEPEPDAGSSWNQSYFTRTVSRICLL